MMWRGRDGVQRVDQQRTAPLPRVGESRRAGGALRGLSGAFTLGLVLLALTMLGVQLFGGNPGPGASVITLHFVGAGAAVVLQLLADRNRGALGALCVLGVFVAGAAVLWFGWYQ